MAPATLVFRPAINQMITLDKLPILFRSNHLLYVQNILPELRRASTAVSRKVVGKRSTKVHETILKGIMGSGSPLLV